MRKTFPTIVFCTLMCCAALAQNEAEKDTLSRLFHLDEVTITAKSRQTAVMPVQTLSKEKLEGLSTHSVADALRYFSGVQIKDFGGVGGLKTVDIRSMGSHHLGVFYDGIEIGNAQNGTVDLGKFSLDNIEEIALYNGQKAEIFQAAKDYGSAGTLYIKTRRPRFQPNEKYHLVASMKAGTFGLANPSILWEQKISEKVALSASAEYMFATGRYHFRYNMQYPDGTTAWDTVGIRQNGDVNAVRAEAGLYGYIGQGKWQIKGYYYQSEKGIPQAIVRNVWTCAQRQWDRNAFVQAQIENTFFDRWDTRVAAKYSNDYMRYLNPDTTRMYIDNEFGQEEVYVSWVNRVKIMDWWDVALSADYQYNTLDANLANFVYPERHTTMVALATAIHYKWLRIQASILGNYVSDKRQVIGAAGGSAGGNSGVSAGANGGAAVEANGAATGQGGNAQKATIRRQDYSPAVFVSVRPIAAEEWFVRAFYKEVFRLPTFNDLYYTDIGNIDLAPEYTTQYDLGTEYTKGFENVRLHAKVDGYFNQVKNKIVAVPKGNSQYRWMMMNIGYVEILGADMNVGVEWDLPKGVEIGASVSYTYQKASDKTNPADTICYGGQISYIPWHSGSVIAQIGWKGWKMNYSFIYVGERYHNSANIAANYERPWYTHDMSISKIWHIQKVALHTTVEINNILNQRYEVINNYPMPGVNGKVIIKVEI